MKVKNVFSDVKTTLFCLTANALIMSSILPISDICAQDAANSFPMYRYNLQRTGRVPFAGPSNDNLKWSISSSGEIWSSPVVDSDGVIYVGSTDGNLLSITPKGKVLWAFKTANGKLLWSYKTGASIMTSSPSIGKDNTIYIGSWDKHLHALNADGSAKWNFETENKIDASPAVGEGTVYITDINGKLYAINLDGTLEWRFDLGGRTHSSPAIDTDETIYVGTQEGNLYAIAKDGALKWKFKTEKSITASPTVDANGVIYIGSWDGKLYAVNNDGPLKWRTTIGEPLLSSPAIDSKNTLYVGCVDWKLYALGQ